MDLDRHCIRCGAPEFSDDLRDQLKLDALLGEDDPDRERELPWPDNLLHEVEGGVACWSCLTLQEQRREQDLCERCGEREFHGDGRGSDEGWLFEGRLLCPDCITHAEDVGATEEFLAGVERGKRLRGDDYPADLAALAVRERARIERRASETEDFSDRLA
jgi:hypothetical protein